MNAGLVGVTAWIVRTLLAAFFAFVGYWKALGPIEALAEHQAWVAGFPAWFARVVGWSELLCAAGLLLPAKLDTRHIVATAAIILFLNQVAAIGVHVGRGEGAALTQNLVLLLLLAVVTAIDLRRSRLATP
jgi:uncharacterized membrane protein YphA (DoxX/SURF4 family)